MEDVCTESVPFNCYIQNLRSQLDELGISYSFKYFFKDCLWALFFNCHDGREEMLAFRHYGYFSKLRCLKAGTIKPGKAWLDDHDILVLVKNAYCMEKRNGK